MRLQWKIILIGLFGFFFINVSLAASSMRSADQLFVLMNQRLSYMKEVAAYKYKHHLSAYAPRREKFELAKVADIAKKYGLEVKATQKLFQLQVQAAVIIEKKWLAHWHRYGFPRKMPTPNLITQTRPALIHINNELIRQIAIALPTLQNSNNYPALESSIKKRINPQFVSNAMKMRLLKQLLQIKKVK